HRARGRPAHKSDPLGYSWSRLLLERYRLMRRKRHAGTKFLRRANPRWRELAADVVGWTTRYRTIAAGPRTRAVAVPVMKAAATLLVRLPLRAGRRRLPAITPPEPRRSLTPPHTHIAQPAHVSSSSSDWIHLDGVLIIARRCRQPLMQRDCVTN